MKNCDSAVALLADNSCEQFTTPGSKRGAVAVGSKREKYEGCWLQMMKSEWESPRGDPK